MKYLLLILLILLTSCGTDIKEYGGETSCKTITHRYQSVCKVVLESGTTCFYSGFRSAFQVDCKMYDDLKTFTTTTYY